MTINNVAKETMMCDVQLNRQPMGTGVGEGRRVEFIIGCLPEPSVRLNTFAIAPHATLEPHGTKNHHQGQQGPTAT